MKNVMWLAHVADIGGVEEFVYQLAKNYDRDLTVYYRTGSPAQIERYKEFAEVVKWDGQSRVKCDRFFTNYDISILDYVDADEYYQVLHAEYHVMNIKPNTDPRFNKYFACSQCVKDSFLKMTHLPEDSVEVIYNPIEMNDEERTPTLLIGSFTRLTGEKGKKRIQALVERLDNEDINYLWIIYTNDTNAIKSKNVLYLEPRLDGITNIMANLDFVAQLSNTEGWSYTMNEAKCLGVPQICTNITSFREMGISEKDIVMELDMSNIDEVVKKIVAAYHSKKPRYSEYKPKIGRWDELLLKGRRSRPVKVRALDTYQKLNVTDGDLKRMPKQGEVFEVSEDRLNVLLGENDFKIPFVELVKRRKS